jgi:hypothetical protein
MRGDIQSGEKKGRVESDKGGKETKKRKYKRSEEMQSAEKTRGGVQSDKGGKETQTGK